METEMYRYWCKVQQGQYKSMYTGIHSSFMCYRGLSHSLYNLSFLLFETRNTGWFINLSFSANKSMDLRLSNSSRLIKSFSFLNNSTSRKKYARWSSVDLSLNAGGNIDAVSLQNLDTNCLLSSVEAVASGWDVSSITLTRDFASGKFFEPDFNANGFVVPISLILMWRIPSADLFRFIRCPSGLSSGGRLSKNARFLLHSEEYSSLSVGLDDLCRRVGDDLTDLSLGFAP